MLRFLVLAVGLVIAPIATHAQMQLLNVSYDPTLFQQVPALISARVAQP